MTRAKPKPMPLEPKIMFVLVADSAGGPLLVGNGIESSLYGREQDAQDAIDHTSWRIARVEIREVTPPPKPKRSGITGGNHA